MFRYDGKVRVVRDGPEADAVLRELAREPILGFDTETRPTFKKGQSYPVSLLQLAAPRCVYLFQLLQLDQLDRFAPLLADRNCRKAGVALHDDIKKLQEVIDFKAAGFIEISDITQRMGIVNTGLRSLAGHFLHRRISKGAQVTNWARKRLTDAQITYAATDAWISRELYVHLLDNHAEAAG